MATHRRGHGEGSIRQRADGRWEATITLEDRKRKSYYGKTRADVQRELNRALKACQDGLPIPHDGRPTVAQYLTRWLEETAKPKVRPKTYVSYEGHIRLHLIPAIGRVQLTKLAPEQLQRLYTAKLEAGLSARTIGHVCETLRSALSDAFKWGL
jgi:integrase